MAAFISPFRIVSAADSVPWEPTIEDVNKRRWDYVELHRLVGGVDVGLPAPYHMVVARDRGGRTCGAGATKDIYSATEQFNRCFAAFLVASSGHSSRMVVTGSLAPYADGFVYLFASGSVGQYRPSRGFCEDLAALPIIDGGLILPLGEDLLVVGRVPGAEMTSGVIMPKAR